MGKKYQFKILDSYNYVWHSEEGTIAKDYDSFDKALTDHGINGWFIVAVNFVERKDRKSYIIVTMQREYE